MAPKILFRADSSVTIGNGHVSRLLALAWMLKDDFSCRFVSHSETQFLREQLGAMGLPLLIVPTIAYPSPDDRQLGAEVPFDMATVLDGTEIVVLDGYWFGPKYQEAIVKLGCKLVCIDDLHDQPYLAHVVINHAPGLNTADFNVQPHTRLLLGLDYALLRPAFFDQKVPGYHTRRNVLIGLGEATEKLLPAIVRGFYALEFKEELIIVGNSSRSSLLDEKLNIRYSGPLDAYGMSRLMIDARWGIFSASTIAIEACACRLPVFITKTVHNQHNIYQGMINCNLAIGIGSLEIIYDPRKLSLIFRPLSENILSEMLSDRCGVLFDRKSPERHRAIFAELVKGIND